MIKIDAAKGVRTMMIVFQRGDYVIEKLREVFAQEGIDTGLIVGGIGSLDICHLHTITRTEVPSVDRYLTLEGPVEVGSLQGSIAGAEPHIHIVVDDVANDKVYVGHLEPGSRCCYRMELGIIAFEGTKTKSVKNPQTSLIDIVPAEE
ncbi:MAG: DNA-binding protein [Chloroflexi bacterium]|nr:DNA-binding protein [Chloroflexota bacterium]